MGQIVRILKALFAILAVRWTVGSGVAFGVYQWIDSRLTTFFDDAVANLSDLPADTLALMSVAGIFEALSILFAAFLTGIALRFAISRATSL